MMRRLLSVLLSVGLLSTQVFASAPAARNNSKQIPPKTPVKLLNVELDPSGILVGQLIDDSGVPRSSHPFRIASGKSFLSSKCDSAGRFAITGLNGGICRFEVDGHQFACRVWRHGVAPPGAISSVALVVSSDSTVRGNRFGRGGRDCPEYCECQNNQIRSSDKKYGLAILALVAGAGYMAISRDNASD